MRLFIAAILLTVSCCALPAAAAEPGRVDFARDVRPILERACGKCHGPDKQQGGLRFDIRKDAFGAGDSGSKAIEPGKPADSELIRRLEASDPLERMPLKADRFSKDQIDLLKRWIEQGAVWPEDTTPSAPARRELVVTDEDRQHWSYRPLRPVAVPATTEKSWATTDIDRFILAALEAKAIRPNATADRRTLIRRVYFDLLGLPPSPAEVAAFVADPSPTAYEELVERLLANPHYGERWGRHWLDVARYADSDGIEADADRPTAHKYRDFVIQAFNDDFSYQKFVRWQLAGDEYEPDNPRALVGTGFLAAAQHELLEVPMEEEKLRLRYDELDDMAATTVSAFLGLTLACTRCHDHKFDAIPTRDYYRLQAAFMTTDRAEVLLAPRDVADRFRRENGQWKDELKPVEKELADSLGEQTKPHAPAIRAAKIDALSISAEEKTLLKERPDSEEAKQIARRNEKALKITDDDYRRVFTDDQRSRWDTLKAAIDAVKSRQPKSPPTALGIVDSKPVPDTTWLLNRGDFYSRLEPVQVGFLTVLTGARSPEEFWKAARDTGDTSRSTMQRRAIADWIADMDYGAGALLARVMVNRVWQHHFGEGLVRTPNDFGVRGDRPTHPELLEWLAREFVASGWRLKHLHRLIMASAVYRQSTDFDATRWQADPDNRLLWRKRPQRLEAEILRDSVLAVSGTLNPEQFGPAFKPPIPAEAIQSRNTTSPYPKDVKDTPATRRRAVYMFHKRVVQHPLMQAFDGPDATVSCGRRINTTVALQGLALMNDVFVRDRAIDFAKRLTAGSTASTEALVEQAYQLSLSRKPTDSERATCTRFIEAQLARRTTREASPEDLQDARLQAVADFCQTLFSLNEFIYVD